MAANLVDCENEIGVNLVELIPQWNDVDLVQLLVDATEVLLALLQLVNDLPNKPFVLLLERQIVQR